MKLLFISDIHGVTTNLKLIDKLMEDKNIDKLICLGDLYSSYGNMYDTNDEEVSKFLFKYSSRLICMKGNCDSELDVFNSPFLINPGIHLLNVDNHDIYITHGNTYSYSKGFDKTGILIYGHEHTPYIRSENGTIYICVGSISLPRNNIATYAIYEDNTITIYDINNDIVDYIDLN